MKKGFSSRKFLLSLASFLASIGGTIGGIVADNQVLTIVGAVCAMLSAAIYAAVEAYVDGKSVEMEQPLTPIQETAGAVTVEPINTDLAEISEQVKSLDEKLEKIARQ